MLALTSCAWAATPVISDLPAEIALALTEERTGIALGDLHALDLSDVVGAGLPDVIPCTGPPVTQDELRTQLAYVIDQYDSGRGGSAREHAAGWPDALACLTDPVDPEWLWSAGFVTGVLAWANGDREAARIAWVAARAIDPRRPWDDNFTPGNAVDVFATALSDEVVFFDGIGGSFLVDGRKVPSVLPPGRHVVQVEDPLQTWVVDMHSSVVAVHPAADPTSLSLDELSRVIAWRMPDADVAYVVRGDEVAELDLRAGSSRLVLPPDPSPARPRWGRWVAASGAALVAGGLLANALVFRPAAVQASENAWAATDLQEWTDAQDAYDAASAGMVVGYGVAGLGLTLVIVGTPDLLHLRRGARGRDHAARQGP